MESSITHGLIGGMIAVAVCTYISSRARNKNTDGNLRFGWFMALLGWCCTIFVGFAIFGFFYDQDAWEKPSEMFSIIGIFIGFGIGAIYSFGEFFKVRGAYDAVGISFYTPWTGKKEEKWSDLKSVKFNSSLNWYVLTFRNGSKIRLSNLLGGHGGVLELLAEMGHDF